MKGKAAATPAAGKDKYDNPIRVKGTPRQILKTVFAGRPKPKGEWRYLCAVPALEGVLREGGARHWQLTH